MLLRILFIQIIRRLAELSDLNHAFRKDYLSMAKFFATLSQESDMSENLIWSGKVDAKMPKGQIQELPSKRRDNYHSGQWLGQNGSENFALTAPQGRIPREGETLTLRNPSLQARLGNENYPVGNHKYRWSVPAEGTLTLFCRWQRPVQRQRR